MSDIETDLNAESERLYSVVLSVQVWASSAQEAFALVDRETKRHLYLWPAKVEAATELIDGPGGAP